MGKASLVNRDSVIKCKCKQVSILQRSNFKIHPLKYICDSANSTITPKNLVSDTRDKKNAIETIFIWFAKRITFCEILNMMRGNMAIS